MKVKLFDGNKLDIDRDMNLWLAQHPRISIIQMTQSQSVKSTAMSYSYIVITLLYEDSNES